MAKTNKKSSTVEKFRAMISAGELLPGQKLKNGIDLAREFGVAHLTMRRALKELELSGEIRIVHGRGIFVSERPELKHKFLVVRHNCSPGVLSANFLLPYFLMRCTELGAEVDEADLMFLRHSPPAETARRLKENQYSGILLCCSSFNGSEPELQIFRRLDIPILISRGGEMDAKITGYGVLRTDERQAWKEGLTYLKNCGFTKAALIFPGHSPIPLRGLSLAEHEALLKKTGLEGEAAAIKLLYRYNTDEQFAEITEAVRELMSLEQKPDVIYCYSDFIALHVYRALGELKLKIPDDISVMGFSGYPGTKMLSPPLSTVDCDYVTSGILAAEKLCDPEPWYLQEESKRTFIIPHKIKKRASTEHFAHQQKEVTL